MSKRSQQLFDYLVDIATNIQKATEMFEREIKAQPSLGSLANQIKEFEKKGDEMTGAIITVLNNTYITPLEREDFLALALKLDDIIDGLDACSVRYELYSVKEMTPEMIEFATIIKECVVEIAAAMDKLRARKLMDIRVHIGEINRLEKRGDQLLRHCLRSLFSETVDVLTVIKYKEIYEILESVTDRCEDVADVLDSVIVKNA